MAAISEQLKAISAGTPVEERRAALREARAAAFLAAVSDVTFPVTVAFEGGAVTITARPRRHGRGAVAFHARVMVGTVMVDEDNHVVVNPPLLIEDPLGEFPVERGGRARRYRVDAIGCAARVAYDSAIRRLVK